MATSLENLGNEFEITIDENTNAAEKNEVMLRMIGVMDNFVNSVMLLKFTREVAMATEFWIS